jgi:hypothetical protein
METMRIFNYNETPITFSLGDTTMINATQMAKPFNKRPVDYLRLPSTNELISAIVRKSHISENQLVISKQGSTENGGGTWLHEDIALDFAQWLSVDFKLWCNDRIKELLRAGAIMNNKTQGRYDASRNILPGAHSPEARMVGGHSIWTILIAGVFPSVQKL